MGSYLTDQGTLGVSMERRMQMSLNCRTQRCSTFYSNAVHFRVKVEQEARGHHGHCTMNLSTSLMKCYSVHRAKHRIPALQFMDVGCTARRQSGRVLCSLLLRDREVLRSLSFLLLSWPPSTEAAVETTRYRPLDTPAAALVLVAIFEVAEVQCRSHWGDSRLVDCSRGHGWESENCQNVYDTVNASWRARSR